MTPKEACACCGGMGLDSIFRTCEFCGGTGIDGAGTVEYPYDGPCPCRHSWWIHATFLDGCSACECKRVLPSRIRPEKEE